MNISQESASRIINVEKDLLGYIEVNVFNASIELETISCVDIESTYCEVLLYDREKVISNSRTQTVLGSSFPEWNESVTVRAATCWTLCVTVVMLLSNNRTTTLSTQPITMELKEPRHSYPLFFGLKTVGTIDLHVQYRQNKLSLKYLLLESLRNEQLPFTMIKSILSELEDDSKSNLVICEDETHTLIEAADSFTLYLTDETLLTQQLTHFIGSSCSPTSMKQRGECLPNDDSYSTYSGDSYHPVYGLRAVSLSKVASGAKNFLGSLMQQVPQSPSITINQIEKMLSIYIDLLQSTTTVSDSVGDVNSATGVLESLSWPYFTNFIIVAELWLLLQSHLALTFLASGDIEIVEYDAIRFAFSQYDDSLNGHIPAQYLLCLLQDMGQDYTPSELSVLTTLLDADSLGIVEFTVFLQWWCS